MKPFGRPWVVFNVEDPQHRLWYAEFLRTKSWAACPVRFIHQNEGADGFLSGLLQSDLIKFYTDQEFGKTRQKKELTNIDLYSSITFNIEKEKSHDSIEQEHQDL
jgi:hypothetical protein